MSTTIERPATPARGPGAAPEPSPPPSYGSTPEVVVKRRRPSPFLIAGLVLVTMLGFGLRSWLFSRTHVSSDNAQVEGHIVPVLPKAAGFVTEVRVRENERVHAGDVLVTIDDRDYRVKLAQAEADLGVATANAGAGGHSGQAEAQLAGARASVAEAEAGAWRAHADLDRYRELSARGVVGRQVLDNAQAAARTSDAQLDAARKQVEAAAAGLTGAEAKESANRALRDQAALQLSYTRVLAPSDGVVSKKSVEVGQLVQVGQPLMTVVPLDDVWVVANLKETEVRDVNAGDRVAIKVDAYPGRKFAGHVESLSPASGARFSLLPPDNSTGNFTKVVQRIPVKIALDGPQDPQHPLRPGMSVEAVVTTR